MITLIVFSEGHGHPVEFRVYEDTLKATYTCVDCGRPIVFEVRAQPTPKPAKKVTPPRP
jgi:hypothetical protein